MKKIRNIIFDVGNVLFNYYPEYIIKELLPAHVDKDFYLTYLFHSDYWQQLDRGDLSERQVVEKLVDQHNLSDKEAGYIQTLIQYFPKHLILNEDMKFLFENCCKHYDVYILSNFQSNPFLSLLQDYPFLNLAKGRVISADVMMKKPELGIFHYLLSQYSILPTESIFIDDLKDNILAAEKMQIKGIVHQSYYQTKKELHAAGVTL